MKCLVVLAILLHGAAAFACRSIDESEGDNEECGPYHPWSWALLASGAAAYSGSAHGQPLVAGELRIRHGGYHGPDAWTTGIEVSTTDFAAIAPAALVGYQFIDDEHFGMNGDTWLARLTGVAAGGGYDYATHRAFGTARLAMGMMFDGKDGEYITECIEQGPCPSEMLRHRAELELVLQLRIGADGDGQLSIGVAFDPLRILTEAAPY